MWRRVASELGPWRSAALRGRRGLRVFSSLHTPPSPASPSATPPLFNAYVKKRAEDVMPIATGLEREEIQAELEGRKQFDMDAPVGPFGTKEAPAVVQSWYNKRIVGCPGGEGEDEHDVVWFWLEKDNPHECPVCSQYFVLETVGEGGSPGGHSDEEHL